MKKVITTTAAVGALGLGGIAVAAPAQAAVPAEPVGSQISQQESVSGDVSLSFDPVAVANAIKDAVNDQSDRGGAVRAALDVASAQSKVNVAIANKDQDTTSQGEVWAEHLDIKGGNYVVYFYDREGSITNNGDGGWINWGFKGVYDRNDNVVTFK